MDPRHHVLPGQPLRLAAEQVNALNRMTRVSAGFAGPSQESPDFAKNTVLVKNSTSVVVPRFGVLGISDPQSAASNQSHHQFAENMVLNGVMPAGGDQVVGVAIEPIEAGKIGRVAVSGRFAAKVKVLTTAHKYARGRKDDVTQLITAECGPFRIVWLQPGVTDGAFAAVIG